VYSDCDSLLNSAVTQPLLNILAHYFGVLDFSFTALFSPSSVMFSSCFQENNIVDKPTVKPLCPALNFKKKNELREKYAAQIISPGLGKPKQS